MLQLRAYQGQVNRFRVSLRGYPILADHRSLDAAQLVVATAAGETAALTKTLGSGIELVPGQTLQIEITLAAADTADLGAYPHYCRLSVTPPGGAALEAITAGYIDIEPAS